MNLVFLLACASVAEPGPAKGGDTSRDTVDTVDTADTDTDTQGDSDTGTDTGGDDPPPAGATVLVGVTAVDHRGAQDGVDVILVDGDIWAVRPTGGPLGDAARVEGGGFVVPGLVDAHAHLSHSGATVWPGDPLEANLRASLYHGVLAVYDVGGPDHLFALRDRIDAGLTLGPALRVTGPFLTAVGSHPCETWPDPDLCVFVTPEDAGAAARARADAGADAVKVALADAAFTPWGTPRLDVEALRAIAAGPLPVIAHVDTAEDARDALDAGAWVLAHPPFDAPLGDADARAVAAAAAVHSTVGAFAAVGALLDGTRDLDDPGLIVGPGVVASWTVVRSAPEVLLDGWVEASAEWAAHARANVASLRAAGGTILPGSDAGYYFQPHGLGLHDELDALVAAGWSSTEAFEAATWTSRRVLGFEGGEVRAGEPADLLLLPADPRADVRALRALTHVVRAGVVYAREDLRAVDLQVDGEPCFDDEDCGASERCDAVHRVCADACSPTYATWGACDEDSWCMPADGLDSTDGVCHAEVECDLYAQDCAPAAYGQACVPLDVDTTTCWYGGPREAGDACSWDDADAACAPGLFCSFIDATCYTLCDPDATDTCPRGTRCRRQEAARGEPWFGLCL